MTSIASYATREQLLAVEECALFILALGIIGTGTFFLCIELGGRWRAPYGRYVQVNRLYGRPVDSRLAWFLQAVPSALIPVLMFTFDSSVLRSSSANAVLLACFGIHYFHRAVIYPLRVRSGHPIPLHLMLLAFVFCLGNGYLQARTLSYYKVYSDSWTLDPRFIAGMILWITGFSINLHSDNVLLHLRRSAGDKSIKIPRGGMFEYVSAANFFGEILEWLGYAIASWSLAGFAFFWFTFCNLAPRGVHHHHDYVKKFPDYPTSRRALIPFLW